MSKRAIILAGGKGTRLRPYTVTLPKPLVPVGDTPILEIIIKQLVMHGFDHITITVNHLADIITAFFGDGSKWGIKIDYSLEEKALSTMGPLSLIKDLPDDFIIMNGDVLTDLDYSAFFDAHLASGSIFSISSHTRYEKSDYGILEVDNDSSLIGFHEKPEVERRVSMGIYAANKKILDFIPYNEKYGFDDLMIDMIKKGTHPLVIDHPGYWLDIGRPDDYAKACEDAKIINGEVL